MIENGYSIKGKIPWIILSKLGKDYVNMWFFMIENDHLENMNKRGNTLYYFLYGEIKSMS